MILRKLFLHTALIGGATLMFLPFLWLVLSSFKKPDEIFTFPPVLIPHRDEVKVEGRWYEAEQREVIDGVLTIRVAKGPRSGTILEISTAKVEGTSFIDTGLGFDRPTGFDLIGRAKERRIRALILESGKYEGKEVIVSDQEHRSVFGPQWRNYVSVLTSFKFLRYFANTIFVVLMNIIGVVLSSSLSAYGFARIDFKGRNLLFGLMLSSMMLPGIILLIPHFQIWKLYDKLDTYWPLCLPAFFGSPFYVFMLRQFFRSIPPELSDAARIDGCNELMIFLKIIIPLSKPAIATVAVFTFLAVWNDFIGPLIYLFDTDKFTLALGLSSFKSEHSTKWHLLMASSTIMIIPVILLFFFAQRFFIKGLRVGGVKG